MACPSTQSYREEMKYCSHVLFDPKEGQVNRFFISWLTSVECAWGKAGFHVGRTSDRNRNFHLWGIVGSPAGDFQGSQLKVVCLWPLFLQEVSILWRMVNASLWLLRLDCWLGTLKFKLTHPVEGDSLWGPSGILAEKSFPVSEMKISVSKPYHLATKEFWTTHLGLSETSTGRIFTCNAK